MINIFAILVSTAGLVFAGQYCWTSTIHSPHTDNTIIYSPNIELDEISFCLFQPNIQYNGFRVKLVLEYLIKSLNRYSNLTIVYDDAECTIQIVFATIQNGDGDILGFYNPAENQIVIDYTKMTTPLRFLKVTFF